MGRHASVFLTGEQGNLAYNLARRFEESDYYNLVWSYNHQVRRLCQRESPSGPELDVRNIEDIRSAFALTQPDIVVHIAALVNTDRCSKDPGYAYETNVLGSYNMAKVAQEFSVKYVYFSTTATYEPCLTLMNEDHPRNPKTLYGQTKYIGELVTLNFHPEALIILPCFVYGGKRDFVVSNIARIARNAMKGNPDKILITLDPDRLKDYMHVSDFVEAVFDLIDCGEEGLYNISGMHPVPFSKVLEIMSEHAVLRYQLVPEADYMGDHLVDSTKLQKRMGWEPVVGLQEGIRRMFQEDIPGGLV